MALLDCRDTSVSLWREGDVVHSPGFVLYDDGTYHFGHSALEQARVRPRDSNSRFWWQLGTQPLKPSLGPARHTADLVHSHLRHVHREAGAPDTLTLAVPDSMPREQLSLLLGVAQACDFRVAGLVSRSVLLGSAALPRGGERLLHLEAQLNQTILNELTVEAGALRLARSTPLPACGLLALQERCIAAIASAFIQQTRFDPRRSAASEQALFNRLPQILAELTERGEASIDIEGHRCRVTAAALASASERLIKGVAEARGVDGSTILLDPELARLPGIEALSEGARTLPEAALWEAWRTQQQHVELDGEEVHLIDRLPVAGGAISTGAPSAAPAGPADAGDTGEGQDADGRGAKAAEAEPTHVLIGTRAQRLRGSKVDLGSGFRVQRDGDAWTLHGDGALINGLPAAPGQTLALGDTLSLGSVGHGRMIEVLD